MLSGEPTDLKVLIIERWYYYNSAWGFSCVWSKACLF